MKFVLFLLAFGSLISCSDLKKEKYLQSIEDMNQTIDSMENVLFNNEIDTLAALGVAANTVELRIKNNYYADTIDMELGKKMDAYKVMRRSLGPLGRDFSTIKKGIIIERETLTSLKSDIENGNGDRAKYEEYVKFEEDKVYKLRKLLEAYVNEKTKTMDTFHELHDELDAFSRSLLKK